MHTIRPGAVGPVSGRSQPPRLVERGAREPVEEGAWRAAARLIDAANALTVRWAAAVCSPAQSTVLSGAGVWPLLGLLAAGAAGPGERELRQAIGVTSGDPIDAAESLLEEMASAPAVQSALGLWTARRLRLNPQWAGRLPAGTRGELTGDPGRDQELLNAWARERTDGLIPAMPVEVDAATRLVLAGALTIRTTWDEPSPSSPRR